MHLPFPGSKKGMIIIDTRVFVLGMEFEKECRMVCKHSGTMEIFNKSLVLVFYIMSF